MSKQLGCKAVKAWVRIAIIQLWARVMDVIDAKCF